MPDDSDPEWLLASLKERVPGTRSAVLLSADGLTMAEHGLGDTAADQLSALVSVLFSHARKAAVIFGRKDGVRQVVTDTDHLMLFAASAGQTALLAVLADRDTDAALLSSEIANVVKSLQPFLATQPRIQGFVKVVSGVHPGKGHGMPRNWRARRGSWAQRRVSSANLVTPCMRNRVMTRLARADQICGPFPVLIRDLSSFQITSRSQCACSTRQCPRTWASRSSGVASAAARLVR
jgi:predicted regulator of Ras-like GTPase activity (Roadblock/LC7/MglB family)